MRQLAVWITGAALIAIAGCNSQPEKGAFKVDLHLDNAPLEKVYLEELSGQAPKVVDTAAIKDASGKVELTGMVQEQGLYRIRFEGGKYILLALDAGDMKIDGDYNELEKIKVSGSDATAEVQSLLNQYSERTQTLSREMQAMDSIRQLKDADSLFEARRAQFEKENENFRKYFLDAARNAKEPVPAVLAMQLVNFNDAEDIKAHRKDFESIIQRFPENGMVKDMQKFIAEIDKPAQPQAPADGPEAMIGQQAPDFTLPDPSGKQISLSSFKGKYVLVDFWASWCGPCRQENPNVVKAFMKYKNKNFTILGVSLDKTKDAWVKAIGDDGLVWSHVSDLKFWESAVVPMYGITGIPTNILVDPQGKIVAANLRGGQLEAKLGELLQ
ncbi:redoxin domain-containing protein [Chitinophaga lutea]